MTEADLPNIDFLQTKMSQVNTYKKRLDELGISWNTLNLLNQVNDSGASIESTQNEFSKLTNSLLNNLAIESLKQLANELNSKSQVVVDIVIRNLFERTADIGFLATDDSIRDFIKNIQNLNIQKKVINSFSEDSLSCKICPEVFKNECVSGNESLEMSLLKNILCKNNRPEEKQSLDKQIAKMKKEIKERLNEYVLKYSVYYDVIITDTEGNILVNLDESNNITKTSDSLIREAIETKNDYVEKLGFSDLRAEKNSILTYSYKITETNDKNSKVLGVLILCFDFEGEMEDIFSSLRETNKNLNLMLLDKNNKIISTSDKLHLPIGTKMKRVIDKDYDIVELSGKKFLAKSAKTKGYEGFFGLEWLGHVMICLEDAFEKVESDILSSINSKLLKSVMHSSALFSMDLQQIPLTAKRIQENLNRTVWNGNLKQQSKIGKKLLQQLSNIGEETKSVFNNSIKSLHETVLQTILDSVSFQAYLAIDIMDRNLYERANDCRWWALTPKFRDILSQDSYTKEDKKQIEDILKYINDLYTVYTNLIVYDISGKILAVSNDKYNYLVETNLNSEFVQSSLKLNDTQKYCVSTFEKTALYNNNYTYIYGSSILSNSSKDPVGAIAIVFDSTPQFEAILNDILISNSNSFAIFANRDKSIISSTEKEFEIGSTISIDSSFFELKNGQSHSSIIEYKGRYYAVGAHCSRGYREYKVNDGYKNDVISLVFTYLCEKEDFETLTNKNFQPFNEATYEIDGTQTIEFGTFFIKNYWYGVETSELVAAIGFEEFKDDINNEIIIGRTFYNDILVEIVDMYKYLGIDESENSQKQIIVLDTNKDSEKKSYLGVVVDALGPIIEVSTNAIQSSETLNFKTEDFVKDICKPPKENNMLLSIIETKNLLAKLLNYKNSEKFKS